MNSGLFNKKTHPGKRNGFFIGFSDEYYFLELAGEALPTRVMAQRKPI
jgi:hypothetical protein